MPTESPTGQPSVAAQYVVTFLKPEMWHIYRQIRALRAFQPVVICQKQENSAQFPFAPVVVAPKPRTHQLRRLWQKTILRRPITIYHSEAARLERVLREQKAEVLHIYFGHIGVHLWPLLERLRLPVVVSFHGADAQVDHESAVYARLSREMFARVQLVLVRSESIARKVEALGCPPGKIRLHRTGLALGEIPQRQIVVPTEGTWRCVQASRLIPKKGLGTALRAFAAFARNYPKASFTIAGEGPMREEVLQQAQELGVADRVTLAGFLGQKELLELYQRAHLYLQPSELGPDGDQEGIPNAMLEAMAVGLPVLATRHGGIPEAVEEGRSGLLVEEQDHEALARAMVALAGDPVRYLAVSEQAAVRARTAFDIEAQTRVLEGHYREAIALFDGV